MKLCKTCGVLKDLSDFHKKADSKDGHRHICKSCKAKLYLSDKDNIRAKVKTAYINNPGKYKDQRLRSQFNISLDQYTLMLSNQNFACKICKQYEKVLRAGKEVMLAVDHDHSCCPGNKSCGKCIRGLLCTSCNVAIGLFQDDEYKLLSALAYLRGEL